MAEAEASYFDAWFSAAKTGKLDDLQQVLKQQSNLISEKDHQGNTALHYAAGAGRFEAVKFLVNSKAALSAQNNVGDSPLHKAAWRNHKDVVSFLVEKGADIQAKNSEGQRPIDLATNPDVKFELSPPLDDVDVVADDYDNEEDEGDEDDE